MTDESIFINLSYRADHNLRITGEVVSARQREIDLGNWKYDGDNKLEHESDREKVSYYHSLQSINTHTDPSTNNIMTLEML